MEKVELDDVDAEHINLTDANLSGAWLEQVNFDDGKLDGVD